MQIQCEDLCDLGRLAFGSAKEEKAEKLFGMAYQMNPDEDRLAWCALARGLRNVSPSMPDLGKVTFRGLDAPSRPDCHATVDMQPCISLFLLR